MANFEKNVIADKDSFIHEYANIQSDVLGTTAHDAMSARGYKLIEGTPGKGVYEKGNRTMRLLFGAFSPYHKTTVQVSESSEGKSLLQVAKQTSGMSGGLIGMNQVKKEIEVLNQLFKQI